MYTVINLEWSMAMNICYSHSETHGYVMEIRHSAERDRRNYILWLSMIMDVAHITLLQHDIKALYYIHLH